MGTFGTSPEPILIADGNPQCHTETLISYLVPLLAIASGIMHAALAPVIVIAGVKPNLILIAVVLVTCLVGFLPGIVWAFAGGLTSNLLSGDPLGSVPLVLLCVAALVTGGQRILAGRTWIYPVLAALAGSAIADLLGLGIRGLVTDPGFRGVPVHLLLPAAVLNAAITALLLYPAQLIAARAGAEGTAGR